MVPGLARKTLLWSFLILFVLGGFFFIDASLYYFIPPSLAQFAPDYRGDPTNDIWMGNLRYYFRPDPLLGFDITPFARAKHVVLDGLEYNVFANELGCFDKKLLRILLPMRTIMLILLVILLRGDLQTTKTNLRQCGKRPREY